MILRKLFLKKEPISSSRGNNKAPDSITKIGTAYRKPPLYRLANHQAESGIFPKLNKTFAAE